MKAVQIVHTGAPELLELRDVAVPVPGRGEVSIDVAFVGVNFADVILRRGGTVALALPATPGIEVSGRVRALGEDVRDLVIGQPVAALTTSSFGGYAEVVTVDARLVAPLPDEARDTLLVAAGTPSNTTTAVLALTRAGRLTPEDRLLVHAAASGLGSQFGQVAKALLQSDGVAPVTGTVGSAAKIEAARSYGYDEVILRDVWAETAGSAALFDVIVDPVGGDTRARSIDALRADGRLVVVGNASDAPDRNVGATALFYAGTTIAGFNLGSLSQSRPDIVGDGLRHAIALVVEGRVHIDVNTVLPLSGAIEAHRRMESAATTGKAVLEVHPPA